MPGSKARLRGSRTAGAAESVRIRLPAVPLGKTSPLP